MKTLRIWLSIFAAILFAAAPCTALADFWINGTGDLKPYDFNKGCSYHGQGFHCTLGYGQSTLISFHNSNRRNGCGFKAINNGSLFKGDKWDLELFNGGWANEKCTMHWLGSNTVEIIEPK